MGRVNDLYGIANQEEILGQLRDRGVDPLYLAVMGSWAYGLNHPGSDLDIRGIYLDPPQKILALHRGADTIELKQDKMDLQLYELSKALQMLNSHNGNLVELLLSPTCFYSDQRIAWRKLVSKFLTKELGDYYRGYAFSQKRRHSQNRARKSAVYTYRELLSGIHLLHTGFVEFNFFRLFNWFEEAFYRIPLLDKLLVGPQEVDDETHSLLEYDWVVLQELLDEAIGVSGLPESCDGYEELNTILWGARLQSLDHLRV